MLKPKLGIVIPTYNEKDNILILLQQISQEVVKHKIPTIALIMDDNSPDETAKIVQQELPNLESDFFQIQVQVRPNKMGLASAYKHGFLSIKSEVDYLLEMDADLSHQPKYIFQLLSQAESGFDLVIGSRYVKNGGVEGWSWFRKIISSLGSLYARIVLGTQIRDFTGGYNLYRTTVFDAIHINSLKAEGYLFQIELKYKTVKSGFRFVEVPIIFPDRQNGQSKMSQNIFWEAFFGVIKLRWEPKN